jgi:hypothetical protein
MFTPLTTVYATDEDIATFAAADFAILCPKDQKLAAGTDGGFGPTDPWTLTSDSVDFSACGLEPGQVVQLTKPVTLFKPPGELLVIDSLSATSNGITLRRKGQPSGVGQPPGGQGVTVGVEFLIATLGPQIERASYDLNRRYGIDDLIAGRQPSSLYDPLEVNEVTVLTVLQWQYLAMSREAGEHRDTFAAKAQLVRDELDELLARVVVHWNPAGPAGTMDSLTTRFSTRLTR